jgi:mevalonate kinase
LAIPLGSIRTTVELLRSDATEGLELCFDEAAAELSAADRELARTLLARAAALISAELGRAPGGQLRTRTTIPIGCGLGSSASFAVALVGVLHRSLGHEPSCELLREHAHLLERAVHGSPSGIDDSVIATGRSLAFQRDDDTQAQIVSIEAGARLELVFASTGRPLPTREAVARVAALGQREPQRFAELLGAARSTVERGIDAFTNGDRAALGRELDTCHGLLQQVGVSTPELDRLVAAARGAGAHGAKLTGAGLGGFMLALVDSRAAEDVTAALDAAGAVDRFACTLAPRPAANAIEHEDPR